jgi:hypothetical protein
MAATITDTLKREILIDLYNSTQNINVASGDSDRFYLAIGRSEEWDSDLSPPTPIAGISDSREFQSSIQSMKLVADVSYVVPRYSWNSGAQYSAWDNKYNSNTTIRAGGDIKDPFYVITDDNNVYVCIQQGKDATGTIRNSQYKPIDTSGDPFAAGEDGYIWKFLFNMGAAEVRKFLTSSYFSVEKILSEAQGGPSLDDLSVSRKQQLDIQNAAIGGQVIGIAVDDGGSGYLTPPTITITPVPRFPLVNGNIDSDVVPAQAFARIHNGSIYEVIMKADSTAGDSAGGFKFGKDYFDASVTVDGNAVLRAIVTSDSGMGADPRKDLNSSAIMFHALLDGTEGGDFQVTNDFRQIGIVRNPLKDSAQYSSFTGTLGDSAAANVTLNALKKLYVAPGLTYSNILGDEIVTNQSGSSAILDYFDEANNILYVHQTRETGFQGFDSTDTIYVGSQSGVAPISAGVTLPVGQRILRPAEVNRFSGEVLYIDNRSPVTRDNEQTEDIKIVIDL